nr:reverse transcriptase domain-containing protein [Tanacetum cinerariifolium]
MTKKARCSHSIFQQDHFYLEVPKRSEYDDLVSKFINQFFPPSKTKNLRNEITNFQQRFDESFSEAWDRFKYILRACPHHGFSELHQLDTFYNALNSKDQDSLNSAAGGIFLDKMPRECLAIIESKSKVYYSRNKPIFAKVSTNTSTSSISPDVAELKDMVKALLLDRKTTDDNHYRDNIQEFISQASAVNYNQGNTSYRPPMMSIQIRPRGFPPVPKQSEYSTQSKEQSKPFQTKSKSGKQFQSRTCLSTPGFPTSSLPRSCLSSFASSNTSVSYDGPQIPPSTSFLPKVVENEPEATKDTVHPTNNGISALRPNLRPSIPYPSRMQDQKIRNKANDQQKMGDPSEFLIPYDFLEKAKCLALADLDASINLMPLFVWNKLSLPYLTPTCMNLELADHSISHLVGVVEDVYVKVGTFHFPTDFVVVDVDADPRVPLILGRYFLKTGRAFIDVFEGELTLRVGKEAITFNLDQTSRYSANYNDMTTKQIDIIDMVCEEYSQEVLGFSDVIVSGNPTPYYDPIVSTTSPTLTPFGNSDFLLEEVDAFLALEDDPTSPEVDLSYLDPEGDILFLEAFLNDDPSLPPPNQGNYLPEV